MQGDFPHDPISPRDMYFPWIKRWPSNQVEKNIQTYSQMFLAPLQRRNHAAAICSKCYRKHDQHWLVISLTSEGEILPKEAAMSLPTIRSWQIGGTLALHHLRLMSNNADRMSSTMVAANAEKQRSKARDVFRKSPLTRFHSSYPGWHSIEMIS